MPKALDIIGGVLDIAIEVCRLAGIIGGQLYLAHCLGQDHIVTTFVTIFGFGGKP